MSMLGLGEPAEGHQNQQDDGQHKGRYNTDGKDVCAPRQRIDDDLEWN